MGTLVLKQIIDCKTCILPLQNLVQIAYDLGFKNIDIGILIHLVLIFLFISMSFSILQQRLSPLKLSGNLRFFYGFSRDRRCFTIFESIELVFIWCFERLVAFLQFKKREKHPWRSVTLLKMQATLLKVCSSMGIFHIF